ncbi:MAG: hypothetical protein K2P98_05985 [Neisseriaceae bacterium]|nr:hypothetical protein [Neisseriaceae bacterium]
MTTVSKTVKEKNQTKVLSIHHLYLLIFLPIMFYAAMVCYGRAGFAKGAGIDLVVFIGGFRFHFWWLTILYPVTILLIIQCIIISASWLKTTILGLAFVFFGLLAYKIGQGQVNDWRGGSDQQMALQISCFIQQQSEDQVLPCLEENLPSLIADHGGKDKVLNIFEFLKGKNFSFFRKIPTILKQDKPIPIGFNKTLIQTGFDFSWLSGHQNISIESEKPLHFMTGLDARLFMSLNKHRASLAKCEELNVAISMDSSEANDVSQLFFMSPNGVGFNEAESLTMSLIGREHLYTFRLKNKSGFSEQFRFDPATKKAVSVRINDIEFRCLKPL